MGCNISGQKTAKIPVTGAFIKDTDSETGISIRNSIYKICCCVRVNVKKQRKVKDEFQPPTQRRCFGLCCCFPKESDSGVGDGGSDKTKPDIDSNVMIQKCLATYAKNRDFQIPDGFIKNKVGPAPSSTPIEPLPDTLLALKAILMIQRWYRRYLDRLESRRLQAWSIYESLEYSNENDQTRACPPWHAQNGVHAMSELLQLHLFVLHGISLQYEHLISFSNPVGANEVSGGTVVGFTAVLPSSCDQP
ncbi:hypothetical protein LSAT2_026609 [Lamellibrachia satsuma]|nr:hypothetical protein LSAT2_026609 [Lamellibrachia satsuma]